MGYKDFQQSDSTCISYLYSSPTVVLPIKRQITVLFKYVEVHV